MAEGVGWAFEIPIRFAGILYSRACRMDGYSLLGRDYGKELMVFIRKNRRSVGVRGSPSAAG
jgi:hypothetical protein